MHASAASDGEAFLVGERFGVNGDQRAVDLVLPQRRHRLLWGGGGREGRKKRRKRGEERARGSRKTKSKDKRQQEGCE